MLSKRKLGTAAVLWGGLTFLMLVGVAGVARAAGAPGAEDPGAPPAAQAAQDEKGTLEIYGFGQADAIADFKQNNPDWYDVNRPSRLPNVANQFGNDGHFYLSARQSRLGVKGEVPTANGPVKGQFEFDMFGVGGDAGQTTIRLRHAWGQWKQFGAGQTNSQFMDVGRVPERPRLLGPERDAVLPERPGVLGAVQRRQLERARRDRGAGRERRRRRARGPRGTAEREAAVPVTGFHGPLSPRRQEVGVRPAGRRRFARSPTTTCCPTTSSI